jgi:hypothetical protein
MELAQKEKLAARKTALMLKVRLAPKMALALKERLAAKTEQRLKEKLAAKTELKLKVKLAPKKVKASAVLKTVTTKKKRSNSYSR